MTVNESLAALRDAARELDLLSKKLLSVEQELAELDIDYRIHVEDAKVAIMQEAESRGTRMPAEDVRNAMANKSWDRDRYRRRLMLKHAEQRAKGRLSDLRELVAAHRSIVSAAKAELEATG